MLSKIKRGHFGPPAIALTLTAAAILFNVAASPPARAAVGGEYSVEDVSFSNDGTTLHGTVLTPVDAPPAADGWPAVVLVAGAGARTRDSYLDEAEAFAEAGIVALIYDKRTSGYSMTQRSFPQLADDALAGLELLRVRDDVDPAFVGLWGHSEGAWVVQLAATRSEHVDFVIATGASALSPSRTQAWSNCQYLMQAGFAEPMCGPVGANLTRLLVAGGMFPEADYDPIPVAESLRVPTLVVLAEFDQSTVPVESAALFADAFAANQFAEIVVIENADHNFFHSPDGFEHVDDRFAPGYLQTFTTWVHHARDGYASASSDRLDRHSRTSTPLAPLGWFESLAAHAVILGALLVAFVSYPISAVAMRIGGRRPRPVAGVQARVLAATGVAAVVGTICFLGYLVATGATQPLGPVVLGRPLVWLALQLVTVTALVAAVWAAINSFRERRRITRGARVRLALVVSGGALLVPWALYWGLLTP